VHKDEQIRQETAHLVGNMQLRLEEQGFRDFFNDDNGSLYEGVLK